MSMDVRAGSNVGGYILDTYIGGGSFGVVWRGHDARTSTVVAVKLLTGSLSSAETAAMRADVELLAAAAASRSPHVVHVLGGGVEPVPHIVMEYVEGSDLQGLLKEKGVLSPEETIDVGLAISDALSALYEAGIIHRDIKPANVMIDSDGVIKLADFGIAKIVGYDTMTMTGQAAMTMAYAAPEIWDDSSAFGRPSHKSDLYAMGVLLYQCLTGDTPFRGNYGALYKAHTERPPDIRSLPAATPPSLRTLIRRCLEKKQDDRPSDAVECANILERARTEIAGSAAAASEPRQIGPWFKETPHESQPWAWRCRHESSGVEATVEVHFADSLDYGATLRRAVAANSKLTSLGAERLIETNRLLLHPNESWVNPPPGRFQFWVAREDRGVTPATSVTLTMARAAVQALSAIIDIAAAEGVNLALQDSLTLLPDGAVYLRRPGLAIPADDEPAESALSFLRNQPLDAEASVFLASAADLKTLAGLVSSPDDTSTVIMRETDTVVISSTVIAPSAPPAPAPPAEPAPTPAFAVPPPPPASLRSSLQVHLSRTSRSAASSWYELTLRNQGAQPLDLGLDASDDADALSFSLPRRVMLAEGGYERVRVHVEPRKRRKFGGKRSWRFTIAVSGGGGGNDPPITVEGEFEEEPSRLPLFAGAGFFGIAILAAIGFVVFGSGGDKSNTGASKLVAVVSVTATATATPTATPVPTATAVPPAPAPAPPPPTPEPNRANCNTIRASGTYLSDAERVWFQTNCITGGSAPVAPPGGGAAPPPSNPGGGTAPPAPTATPRPSVPAQKTSSLVGLTITGGHGSSHRVGEQLTLCYSAGKGQRIRVYDTATPGTLLRQGTDDGNGECFNVTVTLPLGADSVRIDALNSAGSAVTDYAQISIIVVQ